MKRSNGWRVLWGGLVGFCVALSVCAACRGRHLRPSSELSEGNEAPAASGTPRETPATQPAPAPPQTEPAGGLAARGTFTVPACRSLAGLQDACQFSYQWARARCPSGKCDKAVAFFAGGEQNCAADVYQQILGAYAADGYVAGCLTIFESSDAAGAIPYNEEATRVDAVLKGFVEYIGPAWTGANLLISGISHGATAPVTASARTELDSGSAWHGTSTTAACFFDGIYDLTALDEMNGTGGVLGGACRLILPHSRILSRYYDGRAESSHDCHNGQCPCDPHHESREIDEDTVVDVPASAYTIEHWKLIECGSALNACLGDVVPAAPIQKLCSRLDRDPHHDCEYGSMPDDSHIRCAGTGQPACQSWFDQLVARGARH